MPMDANVTAFVHKCGQSAFADEWLPTAIPVTAATHISLFNSHRIEMLNGLTFISSGNALLSSSSGFIGCPQIHKSDGGVFGEIWCFNSLTSFSKSEIRENAHRNSRSPAIIRNIKNALSFMVIIIN